MSHAASSDKAHQASGPQIRETILRIQPYVPGKPVEEVQEELGLTDVIKLASNESPIGPSPRGMEAVQEAIHRLHVYPDGAVRSLRQKLAQKAQVAVDQVVVGNGSDEVIKLLAEAYLQPGDEVIYAAPTFGEYAYVTRLMGAVERPVPVQDMVHDLEAMAAAVTDKTKLLFVCNPNNPTGTYVGKEAVERFLDSVPPHVLVVFDEAYIEYVEAPDFPDVLTYVRANRPVLVLRTFSKIYGLAALRVGYGCGPADIIAQLLRVKEPFNVNSLAQQAALAALDDSEHLERGRVTNRAGKAMLQAELPRLGVRSWPSEANFLWMDVGCDGRAVYEGLLRRGVIVRTGDIFDYPSHLRVTVGTEAENRRFLTALQQVLQSVRGS